MDRFTVILRTGMGINLISPLVPVLALVHHRRTGRFRVQPWMTRLAVLVCFELLVNWGMLGTAMRHIHNDWMEDLAFLPEMALSLWVLSGIGPRPLPGSLLAGSFGLMAACAGWEAHLVGLQKTWPFALTIGSLLLLGFCLWRLLELLLEPSIEPIWNQPAYWLLGAWSMILSIDLTFFPLYNVFLSHLTREWILVPWFAKYFLALILNFGVARTFLCPKPSSS